MKTYRMKRVVVGIMLVILTLGFCVVGTGAARADMGGPPMGGFGGQGGPGGQGFGPGGDFNGNNQGFGPGGDFGGNGQGFGPGGDFNGNNQGFGPRGGFGPGGQNGHGRDGGFRPMDNDVREAIEALEDGDSKTELMTLYENVHTAMEKLREADDDSRESAEAAVKEARDALNTALTEAGIESTMSEPPEKPEGENSMTPPEKPEGEDGMTPPERPNGSQSMTPPELPESNSSKT